MKFILDKDNLDTAKPTTFVSFLTYKGLRKSGLNLKQMNLLIDGSFLVKLCRIVSKRSYNNYHFDLSGFGYSRLKSAIDDNVQVYLFGGTEVESKVAQDVLNKLFETNLIIVKDGYHSVKELRCNPWHYQNSMIVLSIGSPLQEIVALELAEAGNFHAIFTSGGFVSQTARKKGSYYPNLIKILNMRFLYRSVMEAGHMRRILRNLQSLMPMFRDILRS